MFKYILVFLNKKNHLGTLLHTKVAILISKMKKLQEGGGGGDVTIVWSARKITEF